MNEGRLGELKVADPDRIRKIAIIIAISVAL